MLKMPTIIDWNAKTTLVLSTGMVLQTPAFLAAIDLDYVSTVNMNAKWNDHDGMNCPGVIAMPFG